MTAVEIEEALLALDVDEAKYEYELAVIRQRQAELQLALKAIIEEGRNEED